MAKAFRIKKVSADDPSHAAARRIMRTRLREFFSHWRNVNERPTAEQLHALRISGKRLRYSAESLRDFYPDRLTLLLNLLRQLQDLLGEIQDYETQRVLIENDLARVRIRQARATQENRMPAFDLRAADTLVSHYQIKQEKRFKDFALLWRSVSGKKFRAALKSLVSDSVKADIPAQIEADTSSSAAFTHD